MSEAVLRLGGCDLRSPPHGRYIAVHGLALITLTTTVAIAASLARGAKARSHATDGLDELGDFRCDVDCDKDPLGCVSEDLYKGEVRWSPVALLRLATPRSMDDCWEQKRLARDPQSQRLRADPIRFPNGMQALGDYYRAPSLACCIYAESQIPVVGTQHQRSTRHSTRTLLSVPSNKVDGCGPKEAMPGYEAMGAALRHLGTTSSFVLVAGTSATTSRRSPFDAHQRRLPFMA